MYKPLLFLLAAASMEAAVIKGTVVENSTGKALARALVEISPVAGSAGAAASVHTNVYGGFEFSGIAAGTYLVTASRLGFVTAHYGQKRWRSAGVPVPVGEVDGAFLNIRLRRYGAISGTVVDENDVGIPEHEVFAYRNTRPPQPVGKVKADDRGVYRISGLTPGTYLIRTAARGFGDIGYVPTFHKESTTTDLAHTIEVTLDEEAESVNVRPVAGRLLNVAGSVSMPAYYRNRIAQIALISDAGRESLSTDGDFKFNPVAPGQYELLAVATDDRNTLAAHQLLVMDRDRTDIRIVMQPVNPTGITVHGEHGEPIDFSKMPILARRKDIAGEGPAQTLKIAGMRALLLPGRWELAMAPNPSYYVARFSGPGYDPSQGHPEGWNEVTIGGQETIDFVLSKNPGTVRGTVTNAAHEAVAGVPVFLEPYDLDAHRRVTEVRMTRTDVHGQFQFLGLAPGTYRLLGTFEYQMPEISEMDAADPKQVVVKAGETSPADLRLWTID